MVENFISGLPGYLEESFLFAYLAVYLGGVLISFTPCIYPVVPITISFIGAHGRGSRSQGLALALLYVLGMALVYAILGAVAALSGKLFGQIQTNPWTYFAIGNLCILMGLSMLDVFTVSVRAPSFVTRVQRRNKAAGMIGAFLVGGASGLVMGPCAAPAFAVILAYAATRQHLIFASSLMFVFAFGMGTLLILIGTFSGLLARLPQSGRWMVRISRFFGWILLGTGEYFLIQAGILWV